MPRLWPEPVEEPQLTPVSDDNVLDSLGNIAKLLQILNLHMTVLSDNQFGKEDVD